MPRRPRPDFKGAYHHVMARGNRGENVFHEDVDRHDFLKYLGKVCENYGWRVFAYCLMGNHYHLLIHTPEAGLSSGMKALNSYHTRRMNWRYETYGHVFQGRFKSILIEDDSYLLEVIRYISMNPVDAGLVRTPSDWAWSSYKVQAGNKKPPKSVDWLEVSKVLDLVSSGKSKGATALKEFVLARNNAAIASRQKLKEMIELDPSQQRELRRQRVLSDFSAGMKQTEIAEKWKVNQSTVQRIIAKST